MHFLALFISNGGYSFRLFYNNILALDSTLKFVKPFGFEILKCHLQYGTTICASDIRLLGKDKGYVSEETPVANSAAEEMG